MEPDPTGVPAAIREALADADAAACRRTAAYARDLATERGDDADTDQPPPDAPDEWERSEDAWTSAVADAIADEPDAARGSVQIKQINGHRYAYLQWREGEQVVSEYVGPVDAGP